MIDYVNESLFKDGIDKQLILQFDETQITNDMIYADQFSLTQSICSDGELRYGGCESSMIKLKITTKDTGWAQEQSEFTAKMVLNHDYIHPFKIGSFKIASSTESPDQYYRDIIAYDKMYTMCQEDITAWANGLKYPMPLKTFRELLFARLNCEYVDADLINDKAIIYAPPAMYKSLYAGDVLKDICEVNACFGIIDNEDRFKFVMIKKSGNAIRIVKESEYPKRNIQQEDYSTTPIGGMFLYQKHTDKIIKYTIDTNPYVFEARALYFGEDDTSLNTICSNFYGEVRDNSRYYPFSAKNITGNLCVECGDRVQIYTNGDDCSIDDFIFEKETTGIQALKDSYAAQGVANYTYNSVSGGAEFENNIDTATNVLLLRCEDEDLLDNIPPNTPDGTLVGAVSDIAYINENAMLKSVGNLYQYTKQYCICQGRTVRAFNEEGQKQSEIVLPSKWYQYNSYAMDPTIWECYMFNPDAYRQDSSLPDVIYKNLIRLIVPKEFCDSYGKCQLDLLGDRFPNLSELIIETEGWYGGICSEQWSCPNLHTVRFTNLTTNASYMFANSYVEHIYFNDSFSCGRLGTSNEIAQRLLSEKLTIHQFDDDDYLPSAAFSSGYVGGIEALGDQAITSCPNLKEIILPRSVVLLYNRAFLSIPNLEVLELRADNCQMIGDFSEEDTSVFVKCGNNFKIRCYSTNTSTIAWCNTYGIEVEIMEKE